MRVTLLGTDLASRTSGQARFLFNIARGLARLGAEVSVITLASTDDVARALNSERVRLHVAKRDAVSLRFNIERMTVLNRVGDTLSTGVRLDPPADWYVVLSDDGITLNPRLFPGKLAYISQGDMALLYLNRSFFKSHGIAKRIAALQTSELLRQHGRMMSKFSLRLANSEFTRQLMTYVYGCPFEGVIYPPIDLQLFNPKGPRSDGNYALAVARNSDEQNLSVLTLIGERIPLRVIGGARIRGAHNLGVVSESEMACLYRGARLLVCPTVSEPFGYAVAEALCCGTPVLAFDSAGPAEIVRLTHSGRLAKSVEQFVNLAVEMFSQYGNEDPLDISKGASATFSIEASALALMGFLSLAGSSLTRA